MGRGKQISLHFLIDESTLYWGLSTGLPWGILPDHDKANLALVMKFILNSNHMIR